MTTPITIITTEYDLAGKPIGSTSGLAFGELAPGEQSPIRIIRVAVTGISQLVVLRLGIIGTSIQGYSVGQIYRIGHQATFNPTYNPTEFFPGINSSLQVDDPYNVTVGIDISGKQSDYIYLATTNPSNYLRSGECAYRWFFNFLP